MAINRTEELEKIADRLGIGKDREVECVGCQTQFRFKDAIILNEGEESKYLCKTCYGKVINGKLKDSKDELLEQLIELEKYRRNVQPTPNIPSPGEPPIQWDPVIWEPKIGDYKITYTMKQGGEQNFMALVPNDSFTSDNKV